MTNLAALGGDERTDGEAADVLAAPAAATRVAAAIDPKTAAALAPQIVFYALVAVFAVLLARIAMQLFAPLPTPTGEPVVAAAPGAAPSGPLVVKNPFPSVVLDEAPVALVEATEELADTSLNLKLTGVNVYDKDPSAIIKTEAGKDKRFVVGDEVAPGVKLDAVQSNQVILLRNGVREALRFENKTMPEARIAPPPARNSAAAVVPANQTREARVAPDETGGGIASASLGPLAAVIRTAPAQTADGQPAVGIYASANRQLFADLGFQEGDLLVSINGESAINNGPRLTALIGKLARDGGGRLIVERNGEEVSIPIDLDVLRGRL